MKMFSFLSQKKREVELREIKNTTTSAYKHFGHKTYFILKGPPKRGVNHKFFLVMSLVSLFSCSLEVVLPIYTLEKVILDFSIMKIWKGKKIILWSSGQYPLQDLFMFFCNLLIPNSNLIHPRDSIYHTFFCLQRSN